MDRSLHHMASELDHMESAGTAAGQAVKVRASALAPVDTGALSRSIRAEVRGPEVSVYAAGIPYAAFQEYGTTTVPASPYLRPALEAATGQIVDIYTGEVERLLDKVEGA